MADQVLMPNQILKEIWVYLFFIVVLTLSCCALGQLIIRSYCNKFQAVFCGCSGYGGRNVGWIKSGTVLPNGAVSFQQEFGLKLVFVSAICIFFMSYIQKQN